MFRSLRLVLIADILSLGLISACRVQQAMPTNPESGATMVASTDGMTLVYIPAGEFKMGAENHTDEEPVHTVNLNAYWIDQTEVTNSMYAQCVSAGACLPPAREDSTTRKEYFWNSEFATYPVIYVAWDDASAYCIWAERRLPTEAEWEKAARGTDERIYPWGNNVAAKGLLNFYYYVGDTSAVGSYSAGASPYGAQDMAGNVGEWTADWYDKTYYAQSPESNPTGPTSGKYRVVRGGAWVDHEFYVRSALRLFYEPSSAFIDLGFRCVEDAK